MKRCQWSLSRSPIRSACLSAFWCQAQLYGAFDEVTREWSDGVASECVQRQARKGSMTQHGLLFLRKLTSLSARSAQPWRVASREVLTTTGSRARDVFGDAWNVVIPRAQPCRELVQVIFDGPVDALWIESAAHLSPRSSISRFWDVLRNTVNSEVDEHGLGRQQEAMFDIGRDHLLDPADEAAPVVLVCFQMVTSHVCCPWL